MLITCRYYARRSSSVARNLQSQRLNHDVYATTPCVVKDAGVVPPPYELHFQTPTSPGWPARGRHGPQQRHRRPPDAEHDYESMDDEAVITDPRYPASRTTDAGSCGYQTVGVETALRIGGHGYAATVVSAPMSMHATRQCSYPPLTTGN